MPQTHTTPQPSRGRAVLSVLTLAFLTGLLFYFFKDHMSEIRAALRQVTFPQILLLLALGLSFPVMESVISCRMLAGRSSHFSFRQGLELSFLGTFGNVATFGAGTMALQGYYLHRCGIMIGPGLGFMALEYVFHKLTVLLYACVLLLFQASWLMQNTSGLTRYLLPACGVVALIILALVLVCTSRWVQQLARSLLKLLPDRAPWRQRKEALLEQLEQLGQASRLTLTDKRLCIQLLIFQWVKLFLLYTIPWLGLRFMGIDSLSFWQGQLLAALMMLLSNALPNVAGMGSIETAFLLVFSGFLQESAVFSALVLYRIASYYVLFGVSAVFFFFLQRQWTKPIPQA